MTDLTTMLALTVPLLLATSVVVRSRPQPVRVRHHQERNNRAGDGGQSWARSSCR